MVHKVKLGMSRRWTARLGHLDFNKSLIGLFVAILSMCTSSTSMASVGIDEVRVAETMLEWSNKLISKRDPKEVRVGNDVWYADDETKPTPYVFSCGAVLHRTVGGYYLDMCGLVVQGGISATGDLAIYLRGENAVYYKQYVETTAGGSQYYDAGVCCGGFYSLEGRDSGNLLIFGSGSLVIAGMGNEADWTEGLHAYGDICVQPGVSVLINGEYGCGVMAEQGGKISLSGCMVGIYGAIQGMTSDSSDIEIRGSIISIKTTNRATTPFGSDGGLYAWRGDIRIFGSIVNILTGRFCCSHGGLLSATHSYLAWASTGDGYIGYQKERHVVSGNCMFDNCLAKLYMNVVPNASTEGYAHVIEAYDVSFGEGDYYIVSKSNASGFSVDAAISSSDVKVEGGNVQICAPNRDGINCGLSLSWHTGFLISNGRVEMVDSVNVRDMLAFDFAIAYAFTGAITIGELDVSTIAIESAAQVFSDTIITEKLGDVSGVANAGIVCGIYQAYVQTGGTVWCDTTRYGIVGERPIVNGGSCKSTFNADWLDLQNGKPSPMMPYYVSGSSTNHVQKCIEYVVPGANKYDKITSGLSGVLPSYYGTSSLYADADGKLYFWLPDGYVVPSLCYVTFNANGGTVSPAMKTVANGAAVGELPSATRIGYTCTGWFSAASGGTQVTTDTRVTADVTFYAQWKQNDDPEQTYIVRLHRNNSVNDGATTGQKYKFTVGASKALPKVADELKWAPRAGYAFLGWATTANATSAKYTDGQSVSLSATPGAEVHLYAVWKAQTYVVTLHRNNSVNDGATTGQKYKFTVGASKALPKMADELKWAPRAGYAFLGWATSANATSAKYSDGQSVSLSSTPGATVHLYAVWKEQTYVVRLHRNNSVNDGATAGRTFTVGKSRALPKVSALQWLRDNYTFVGWATSANATVAKYTDGQTVSNLTTMPGATVHLYAVWKESTYVIRLHRNYTAGDTATAGRSVVVGKSRTLPTLSELGWLRTGYTFLGWAMSANSTDVKCWDGQPVSNLTRTPGATVHLYAVWVAGADKYLVRLHRNLSSSDGSSAGRMFTVGKGRALPTISELNWSRPGYEFLGWSTAANATSAKYRDGVTVSGLSSTPGTTVHLYAVWKVGTYVVRLYRNNSPSDNATAGRTFTIYQGRALPTISELGWGRSGYTFAAWLYPSENGVSAFYDGQVVSDLTIQPGAVIELFAVWR